MQHFWPLGIHFLFKIIWWFKSSCGSQILKHHLQVSCFFTVRPTPTQYISPLNVPHAGRMLLKYFQFSEWEVLCWKRFTLMSFKKLWISWNNWKTKFFYKSRLFYIHGRQEENNPACNYHWSTLNHTRIFIHQ